MGKPKIVTATEAAELIKDNDILGTTAVSAGSFPEELVVAIRERFDQTQHPRNLGFVNACGIGVSKPGRGMDWLMAEGLTTRTINAHVGESPISSKKIATGGIQSYLLPQGVILHNYRASAAKKPGVITKVGLNTFVDPRIEGGKANKDTTEDIVKLIELDGEEYLHYKPLNINVALIRGTYADEDGNIVIDHEANRVESFPLAQLAKNNGGIVIAQVKKVVSSGSLNPKQVHVPGVVVDYLVENTIPEYHQTTKGTYYNPVLSAEINIALDGIKKLPLNERKVLARRASLELKPDTLVNLGIGAPDGVSGVANEEGVGDQITLTLELGAFGGQPAGGLDFGSTYNPQAVVNHDYIFDFYDGGGLDAAFLGAAQVDKHGNVNVSKFGNRATGPGGFINITQNTQKVVFMGTLMVGAEYEIGNQELKITKEGTIQKYVEEVQQITFNGRYAKEKGQDVLYVTERAVFDVTEEGLRIIEVAPGIDIQKDVIDQMGFTPLVSDNVKVMDPEIFQEQWGNLKTHMKNQLGGIK